MDDDRSAALVIGVWLEGGTDQFRGRLTAVDTGAGNAEEFTVTVAASSRELTDALSQWLQRFLRDATTRIDTE